MLGKSYGHFSGPTLNLNSAECKENPIDFFSFPIAKICPPLEAPAVDVWESYAVFERFGTSYGHCTFDGPAKSSPDVWIKWKERTNQGQGSATARCIS